MTVFCKSYGNALIRVFLHAEFISAKQTEPKSMGFEKYAKKEIKSIYHYFLFFVIISKSFKQKLIIPIESCFLEGRKLNIAKLVDMSFLADDMKNRHGIAFAKFDAKMTFLQILWKCAY